jgi:hypothetical protein
MRLTQKEITLAARYRFDRRLSEVVAATLAYQRDRRTHDRALAEVEETALVLATALNLSDQLPGSLGLLGIAETQHARSHRELDRCADRLRASAEVFIETVGDAVPDVLAAMETTDNGLDRGSLLATLRFGATEAEAA